MVDRAEGRLGNDNDRQTESTSQLGHIGACCDGNPPTTRTLDHNDVERGRFDYCNDSIDIDLDVGILTSNLGSNRGLESIHASLKPGLPVACRLAKQLLVRTNEPAVAATSTTCLDRLEAEYTTGSKLPCPPNQSTTDERLADVRAGASNEVANE